MYSLIFILYFCIAHVIFIDLLILKGDRSFKSSLIKSYLWPYMFIKSIYNLLYKLINNIYDWLTEKWENFKAVIYFILISIVFNSKDGEL